MATIQEVINRARSYADRRAGIDIDGAYGAQCVDLPNALSQWYFGKVMRGNAIDLLGSAAGNGYAVFRSGTPQPGDVFVKTESHPYGHTGLIIGVSGGTLETIEQNVGTGGGGGPCVYMRRSMAGIVGWYRMPYSDAGNYRGSGSKKTGGQGVEIRAITRAGHTFSQPNMATLMKYCAERNILPSGAISQLYLESFWGDTPVGRGDNNWAGMTWTGNPNRPSGVVASQGQGRGAGEGGSYFHYNSLDDFFKDWTYLITSSLYHVAGKQDIASYASGLFRVGGAAYDYAASGYSHYASLIGNVRSGINSENNGYMDVLDQAWKEGRLVDGVGSEAWEWTEDAMAFTFNIKEDKAWVSGAVYYYNGYINEIQGVHSTEEWKYLKEIYNDTTGRELKHYDWTAKSPVYGRIFGTVIPGSQTDEINKSMADIIKEAKGALW